MFQVAILQLGQAAPKIIGSVLAKEIVERPDLLEACAVVESSIEPGRCLPTQHQHLVEALCGRMSAPGMTWLTARGPGIAIIAAGDADVFVVPIVDVPSPCDVIILNAKALALPKDQTLGILAHELGHLAYRDEKGSQTPNTTEGEIAADAYAAAWGFRDGLREHLASEIPTALDPKLKAQLEARVGALQ